MGISTFPAPSGGGETNDFILDKNGTTNTTFSPGRSFAGGGYSLVVTGSTAYDIYLLDSSGNEVGYSNGTSIVASAAFETISALGLGTADVVAFTYNGPSTDASTTGDATGAGAFLTSITPSDLPDQDDTAVVAGGNFASDVEINFISGTVTKAAKNVVVGSSTALVVTRPDDFSPDLAPYDLQALNPGVTPPTGTNLNVLSGTVTAGTVPAITNESLILGLAVGSAFSSALQATDGDGGDLTWASIAGTVPAGLTLGTGGVLSGTPTTEEDYFFTAQVTDAGGNIATAVLNAPVGPVATAPNSTVVGGSTYLWFESSDDLVLKNLDTVEYLIIAGGGPGGRVLSGTGAGGGGGGGGILTGTATGVAQGTSVITVGAGGADGSNGSDSIFAAVATATGGGAGGAKDLTPAGTGANGGSGGGAAGKFSETFAGGTGIVGQGFNGGSSGLRAGGGGGGAGTAGENGLGQNDNGGDGGNGADYGAWASAIGIIFDAGYFAGGGGGGGSASAGVGGIGGGGDGRTYGGGSAPSGSVNSGGGGGGGAMRESGASQALAGLGGSGLVVVRF